MERQKKEEQITFLRDALADVESVVLSSVQGLTVSEVSDLRGKLHDAGVNYMVVKNTLAKMVVRDTELSVLEQDFAGPTAIAWSKDDPVAPAKILVDFQKDVEKFEIRSGYNSGSRLEFAQLDALAKLPSLDELRAQLLGTINGVGAKLLAQFNAPASNLVGVFKAKAEKDKEAA
jgi:large subunit ribosomal protein L10